MEVQWTSSGIPVESSGVHWSSLEFTGIRGAGESIDSKVHDMIAYDIVDPNQFGGIRQRSTEDAGLYLTHLIRTGWA